MSWIKYRCGCIEGPWAAETCWQHGEEGVAMLIDCPKGRPLKVWVTNGECDESGLCPARYEGCEYKK